MEDKILQLNIENEKLKMDFSLKKQLLDQNNSNLIVLQQDKDSLQKILEGFQEELILAKTIWQKEKALLEGDFLKQKNNMIKEKKELNGLVNSIKQEVASKDLVIASLMKKNENLEQKIVSMNREIEVYRQKSFDEENKKLVAECEKTEVLNEMETMKFNQKRERILFSILILLLGILIAKL